MKRTVLVLSRPHAVTGEQRLFRFENGYGASVVRFPGSYGFRLGLWELAVVKYAGEGMDDFRLCYSTPITEDVEGYLSENRVDQLLNEIAQLPPAQPSPAAVA